MTMMPGVPAAGRSGFRERGFQPCRMAAARRAPTCAAPTPCWRGSSTIGRTSIPGHGWPSCRRWTCTAPCCSRSPASSCPSRRPAGPWVASRLCSAAISPRPPNCWGWTRRLARPGFRGARSVPFATSPGGYRTAAWDPDVLSRLTDDELMAELTAISGDRFLDRPGRPHHRARPRGRRSAGDLALRKAVQAAYQLDHRPTQQEVLAIAEKWRPYRSLATSYLFSAASERPRYHRSPDSGTLDHDRALPCGQIRLARWLRSRPAGG